jgi:hypothetical protein
VIEGSTPTVVVAVTVPAVAKRNFLSCANSAYEYCVPDVRAVSTKELAGFAASVTRLPAVADPGGVAPSARRIITPDGEGSLGLSHDKAIEVLDGIAVTLVTGPGAVAMTFRTTTGLVNAGAPFAAAVQAR